MKESGPGKLLITLLDEIHNDKQARGTTPGAEEIPRKLVADSLAGIISYAKQVRVPVDLINWINQHIWCVYCIPHHPPAPSLPTGLKYYKALIMGGAVRKDKQIKLDFYLIHSFTASIFLTTFMAQDWITTENKARFLGWKIRLDLFWYAFSGSPPLLVDEIKNYIPKIPLGGNPWLDIIGHGLCC